MSQTETEPSVHRMLVLGTSGTLGSGMSHSGAVLWPEIVRSGLAERLGDVDLRVIRFYVHGGTPFEILERELAAANYDFVVLQCTSVAATQKTVAHRVRNLVGKRAGNWTEARVLAIDHKTRRRGKVRQRVNVIGHRVVRKAVGTSPMIGLQPLIERYLRAIDRVAMVETANVVVIGTGMASKRARENNPAVEAIKHEFDGRLSARARQKHLHWVESAAVTRESPDPEATFVDVLHKGQDWHNGIAERVLSAFLS